MRIVIVTAGTRGEVQPYVALGLGLRRAGHAVRVVAWARYEDFVRAHGLDFAPIYRSAHDFNLVEGTTSWLKRIRHSLAVLVQVLPQVEGALVHTLSDCLAACQEADVILSSVTAAPFAHQVAAALRVPYYPAFIQNVIRTTSYPSALSPLFPDSSVYNWLSYSLVDDVVWQTIRPLYNSARRTVLGLPALSLDQPINRLWRQRQPLLYGISPAVLPKPIEWGDWVHLTGFWFLDRPADWQPAAALVDFLGSGPPPVYVGFGSLVNQNPTEATELVLKALARSGQRGVLATGWGGLATTNLPDTVHVTDDAPFDWLFPRMRAVVQHGGIGTTSTAMRAGVPTIAVPFFYDQPFWANRVFRLGVGPRPIPRSALSSDALATAIETAVSDPAMRARALALGQKIRAEDGVGRAVEALHRFTNFDNYAGRIGTARPAGLGQVQV